MSDKISGTYSWQSKELNSVKENINKIYSKKDLNGFVVPLYLNRTYKKSEGSALALLLFSCLPLASAVKI